MYKYGQSGVPNHMIGSPYYYCHWDPGAPFPQGPQNFMTVVYMRARMECLMLTSKNSVKLKQYSFHAEFLEEIRYTYYCQFTFIFKWKSCIHVMMN